MKKECFFYIGFLSSILLIGCKDHYEAKKENTHLLDSFLIQRSELKLTFHHSTSERVLSYQNYKGDFENWKKETRQKFAELTGYQAPAERKVTALRKIVYEGIIFHALIMEVSENLTIPAYLLEPENNIKGAVMAIHGHGRVEPMIGLSDNYHHQFAFALAKEGYMVLAPELRGFSTLADLSWQEEIDRLDYAVRDTRNFTLVTDGFLHGESLIGKTIEDLVAWENWLFNNYDFDEIDVAGISYGGDLALYYPVFSQRIRRIFSSGSLGSFDLIFSRCYNAPAHCIPNILKWMDRSDVAGLNIPRPIMLHYGELDTPSSEPIHSASYNESVKASIEELKNIYNQMQSQDQISLYVTPGKGHEMDVEVLLNFLK
jgi:dienelactone hydrolase